MTTRDVIVFAGALYDQALWTNRQHIATRLAGRGWRVLSVEPRLLLWTQLLPQRWSWARRTQGGVGRWLLRQAVPWRAADGLWVVGQTNVLPWSRTFRVVAWLNHVLWNGWRVRLHARRLGFRQPVLLLYDTEAAEFLDDFPSARVVYDCVDDHRVQAGVDRHAALVAREEEAIARRADAIAVTTEPLRERFARLGRHVRLVPNAADVRAFHPKKVPGTFSEPADVSQIPHPRIGTCGALDAYKLDVDLLRAVAREHPDWHFVLIGPVDVAGQGRVAVHGLRELLNIHLLGPKPRADIPAYVHAFDVAIIPYRENAYNRASFPLKFWEFLAAGKPVVASGLPSLEPYGHLVALARTPEAFAGAIDAALADPDRGRGARMDEARQHSWERRVDAIAKWLHA